ncbi:Phosphotriesterase-related protein [Seminavis robusta]|uniref:Phosphotriesterase-related protein n=1 Tax=Seminavis robusta TaxID=568900 RepID=A0A9N8HDR9_9STRA|nr:Phosphotriesterase-related protein [Seminavis robusta]|eukprot:Sro269_g104080.1 Phosphotriesterase-related protein (417) ;mRNA; f:58887-60137
MASFAATNGNATSTVIPKAMTVLGPVEELGDVLMKEPLICDPALRMTGPASGTALVWDDLAHIRANPFVNASNMTLSSVPDAVHELTNKGHCGDTLLDTTSVDGGRDFVKARIISQQTGKHIILGTTPTTSTTDVDAVQASKRDIDRMEQELIYGVEQQQQSQQDQSEPLLVRAGFIGELHITDLNDPSQERQLHACAVVQHTTGAPFLLDVPSQHVESALDQIERCGGDLSRTVLTRADLYYRHDMTLLCRLLDRGVCLCFDHCAVASAIWDLDGIYPSVQQVAQLIDTLLKLKPDQYIHQIVLSSGIFMKLQYTKYGGVGYTAILEHLVPRLQAQQQQQQQPAVIDILLRANPKRLLCWWTPPPPKEVPKEYIPCSVCKKMFEPILGEYYTKYSFTYCGTDCLRKHRKVGFKGI